MSDLSENLDYQHEDYVITRSFVNTKNISKDFSTFIYLTSQNMYYYRDKIPIYRFLINKFIDELNFSEISNINSFCIFMVNFLDDELILKIMENKCDEEMVKKIKKTHKDHVNYVNMFKNICIKFDANVKNKDYMKWASLSENPTAIHILENNFHKINWTSLSSNPAAIHILENHLDKVNWKALSSNPSALRILERHLDKVIWPSFVLNKSPDMITFLNQHLTNEGWVGIWEYVDTIKPEVMDVLISHINPVIEDLIQNEDLLSIRSHLEDAIPILLRYINLLDSTGLSKNPGAIDILKANPHMINWQFLLMNKNPKIVELIENVEINKKIKGEWVFTSKYILKYDYARIKKNCVDIFEYFYDPKYFKIYLESHDENDIENEDNYINWFLFERKK